MSCCISNFVAVVTLQKLLIYNVKPPITCSDLASFTALVIISGDGLVFEAINGMVFSAHSPAFPPIAIVPCGSGNAFLRLFSMLGESLYRSQNCWGIIADIDIESERFRKICGGNRFLVQAVCRLANLKTYRGKLSYLELHPGKRPILLSKIANTRLFTKPGMLYQQPPNLLPSPTVKNRNEFISSSSGQTLALDQKIPANWTSIEDEFVLVYAVYLSHISTQAYYMPKAQLNESTIWLTYILKSELPSRLALYHFLNSMEQGTHLDADFCHTIPVSALRLVCQGGKVVVDGELIECDKIQADVSTKTFNVVSL
uniref:DAGKc domain-containing protein n=1 Tax=Ditylenchus dipsaci TaxID=166011 RepID=A0A915DN20_9BILA